MSLYIKLVQLLDKKLRTWSYQWWFWLTLPKSFYPKYTVSLPENFSPQKSPRAKFKPKKGSSPPDIPEYLKEKQPWTKLHDTDQNYGQIPVFLATLLIKKEC